MRLRRTLAALAPLPLFGFLVHANPDAPTKNTNVKPKEASEDAAKAIPRFQMAKNLKASVWASEPMVTHPVAFSFDEKGRCYVCETFRHSSGVTDNRSHMYWLDDELASRTVADRVEMYKKHFGDKFGSTFESATDQLRLLEDTKGAGKADKATVFRDDFGRAEDGLMAGVLARKGKVLVANIPDIWELQDTKGTGTADVKKSLATGFGVHVAFIGHDLHGLTMGPDGRIYFTIGDRGFNVVNKEGKRLFNPDSGAVLRCEPDGSHMEIVHTGLRNPQELAFDDYGNLFTVDNNSDSGDKARFVQIVEGGDSGWRLGYQYGSLMSNRGPWNAEKLWHERHDGQPAYILPPIRHFADGPSGLTHYPGVGLADKYKDHFFLCDFRGNSGGSGIWSFAAKPKGASFEMVDDHHFIWSALVTDCDFGPDGAFYFSDWVEGWNPVGQGRMYRVVDEEAMKNPAVKQAKELLAGDWSKIDDLKLFPLLDHPHRKVRMEASFELFERIRKGYGTKDGSFLSTVLLKGLEMVALGQKEKDLPVLGKLGRIHAVNALGMVARHKMDGAVSALERILKDADAELRIAAIQGLGEARLKGMRSLFPLLEDPNKQVRLAAALAIAKFPANAEALDAVMPMIEADAGEDPYLRHAGIQVLAAHATDEHLASLARLPQASIRLASLLALRKQGSPLVSAFLADKEPNIAAEAARAIHDLDLKDGLKAVAELNSKDKNVAIRSLNANFRLGNANALAIYAANKDNPEELRVDALEMLGALPKPPRRDFVTGFPVNLEARPVEEAAKALEKVLPGVFDASDKVKREASKTAGKLALKEAGPFLVKVLEDKTPADTRVEAVVALDAIGGKDLDAGLKVASATKDAKVRGAVWNVLLKSRPAEALAQVKDALTRNDAAEQQEAFRILAQVKLPEAETLLSEWLEKLSAKKVLPEVQLDILEAAGKMKPLAAKLKAYDDARPKNDDLAKFRETLLGGNAEAGKQVFLNNTRVQCVRCHMLNGTGGIVGPELMGVGKQHPRDYLLESIVVPNKAIAKGFESVILNLDDGKSVSGVLREENDKEVKLIDADGKVILVPKSKIEDRRPSKSAMPEDLVTKLSKTELRDLVAFLASLTTEPKKK